MKYSGWLIMDSDEEHKHFDVWTTLDYEGWAYVMRFTLREALKENVEIL